MSQNIAIQNVGIIWHHKNQSPINTIINHYFKLLSSTLKRISQIIRPWKHQFHGSNHQKVKINSNLYSNDLTRLDLSCVPSSHTNKWLTNKLRHLKSPSPVLSPLVNVFPESGEERSNTLIYYLLEELDCFLFCQIQPKLVLQKGPDSHFIILMRGVIK